MIGGYKKYILLICAAVFFSAAQAQNGHSPIEDMANAIKNDHVAEISRYFDNVVPLTINNTQSIYSRNQAEAVLEDFFEKNKPKDFAVSDNGSPTSTSKFMIGTFDTPSGKYNVYILMKQKDGNFVIQEIRLTRQ